MPLKNEDAKSFLEAIPSETKIFLLVVTVAAIIIFIIVIFIDSKSSCSCYDCESLLPASVVSYVKLSKKKYRSSQRKEKQAAKLVNITGPGVLSKPLGSSLSTPSSSEQDSDDDVIQNYRKSVAISRLSVCQAMMPGVHLASRLEKETLGKQDGDYDRNDDNDDDDDCGGCDVSYGKVDGRMNEEKIEGGEEEKERSSEKGIFGLFWKKDKKVEKEGMCFKNQVFLDELSPTCQRTISTARSFNDLSMTSLTTDQSHQTISPFRTLMNKFNSKSTSKLHADLISLHLTLTYFEAESQLEVNIIEAKDVPDWAIVTRIKITLLPMKKEKFETKPKPGSCPQYNETTRFKVDPNVDVNSMVLRVRMYGGENRSLVLGWKLINFTRVLRTKSTQFWICLETEKSREEKLKSLSMQSIVSCSSGQKVVIPSRSDGKVKPELLLGLSYNHMTGLMRVRVIAGTQLVRSEFLGEADANVYVKLSVMADKGQEIAHNRTSLKPCCHNSGVPFQEMFAFQIPLCQMESVTLVVTAFKVRNKRKEMIGWFALGRSSSGEKENQHWNEMKSTKEEVDYWHVLME